MIKKIKKYIKRLIIDYLDSHGYYKISNLKIGGNCGLCGKYLEKEIFPKDYPWGICEECEK